MESEPKIPIGVDLVCGGGNFHRDRCLICQKSKASKGSEEGISNLKRAAEEKHDVVVKKRIKTIETEKKPFLRHRECVKRYTYKNTNPLPVPEPIDDDAPLVSPTTMVRRSSVQP